jgi:hypothetical protein
MNYPNELEVRDRFYKVEYEKVPTLRSSVKIKRGVVVLKLSRYLFGREKDKTVEKFLTWAAKRLLNFKANDFINPVYEDGARLCVHNKVYELRVIFDDKNTARSSLKDDYLIEITLNRGFSDLEISKKIKFLAQKVIIDDQTPYLHEVVAELNGLYFQEDYNALRFKRVNGRFGSCSSKRNLNISYNLLFAPRDVFKYVCVHELAHLKEFNHSRDFWNLVENAMPEYKEHEKWLKSNGLLLG